MARASYVKLERALDAVRDHKTFVKFLQAIADDWSDDQAKEKMLPSQPYGPSANGWENGDIGAFLEAACACAKSNSFPIEEVKGVPNAWKTAAATLLRGKYYE